MNECDIELEEYERTCAGQHLLDSLHRCASCREVAAWHCVTHTRALHNYYSLTPALPHLRIVIVYLLYAVSLHHIRTSS